MTQCKSLLSFILAASVLTILSAWCHGDDSNKLGQPGLRVFPSKVVLFEESWTQQLAVSHVDPRGYETDHTTTSQFHSDNPEVATVSSSGLIRATGVGQTTILISSQQQQVQVRVSVHAKKDAPPVRFLNDIVPVLTKHGCNSGGCHGKASGQNGFKLSLLGFEPSFDYSAIVKQGRGRRLFPADPSASLLLQKAIAELPHGGGRRIAKQSDDYQTLLRWVANGAPGPQIGDPFLDTITVHPKQRILERETHQQLVVIARYSNGETRDVTRRATFLSNEPDIADTDVNGFVSTHNREGLFTVMIRFGGQIDTFHGTIPFATSETPEKRFQELARSRSQISELRGQVSRSTVDEHLFDHWGRLGIMPSDPVTDSAFIRRVSLDICGTLPTSKEISRYVKDPAPDKRTKLINTLLERPAYADYFGLKWAGILRNRGRGYSTSKQRHGTALFANWIRNSLATNKPYDQFVSEILTATGSQHSNPPTVWYRSVRTTVDYVESVAQAFLGVRIQCAQCHHHPFEQWSEDDYYGFAAIFSRVGRKGGFADAEVPTNELIFLKPGGQVENPRTKQIMSPRPLGGPDFSVSRYQDPRQALATWLSDPKNPFFAKTLVNRVWGHFFGRGIIDPIDDARSTNPPSNPALLRSLEQDFMDHRYDIKHLIRSICNSYAYGLSSAPTPNNAEDTQSFARFYPKRLTAEVLLDAISQVLDVPTAFPGGPGEFPLGTRAIELPDENVANHFLDVFGRPSRTSACECERVDTPALSQALELVNSSLIQNKLTSDDGYIARLESDFASSRMRIHDIFLRMFSRLPNEKEYQTASRFIEASDEKPEAYRSLVWSLLATNEFLFNH